MHRTGSWALLDCLPRSSQVVGVVLLGTMLVSFDVSSTVLVEELYL